MFPRFFGIEPNAFGAVGAVINFSVAFAVSAITRPPPEAVKKMVASIRVPNLKNDSNLV